MSLLKPKHVFLVVTLFVFSHAISATLLTDDLTDSITSGLSSLSLTQPDTLREFYQNDPSELQDLSLLEFENAKTIVDIAVADYLPVNFTEYRYLSHALFLWALLAVENISTDIVHVSDSFIDRRDYDGQFKFKEKYGSEAIVFKVEKELMVIDSLKSKEIVPLKDWLATFKFEGKPILTFENRGRNPISMIDFSETCNIARAWELTDSSWWKGKPDIYNSSFRHDITLAKAIQLFYQLKEKGLVEPDNKDESFGEECIGVKYSDWL